MLTRTAFLIASALLIGACSSDDPDTNPDELTINVQDNSYSPAVKSITVGKTVKWEWKGAAAHSVTFTGAITSPTQTTGTYSRTFDAAGTFTYQCLVHGAAMSGTVTVTAGGSGITY